MVEIDGFESSVLSIAARALGQYLSPHAVAWVEGEIDLKEYNRLAQGAVPATLPPYVEGLLKKIGTRAQENFVRPYSYGALDAIIQTGRGELLSYEGPPCDIARYFFRCVR